MSNTLTNLPVIIIIVATVALALFTYLTKRKRKAASQSTDETFRQWMAARNFAPDQLSFFNGTGIAMKSGDDRVVLQSRGGVNLYPLGEIVNIKTSSSTVTSRPLGAAPGVVEIKEFKIYILEIYLKGAAQPFRILFEHENQLHEWENRLDAANRSLQV